LEISFLRSLSTGLLKKLEVPSEFQYTERMKIKTLIQHLEKINENIQLADFDVLIIDPNGYEYKIRDIDIDEDNQKVVIDIDEGSCD